MSTPVTTILGNVETGGDFTGRDLTVYGDNIKGDKAVHIAIFHIYLNVNILEPSKNKKKTLYKPDLC